MVHKWASRLLPLMLLAHAGFAQAPRTMLWGDPSGLGRPFSKDPSVIRFGGRYLLYYSLRNGDSWAVGIAESRDLLEWRRVGELLPGAPYEAKGLAAPFGRVIDGKVHLFYQTYGNGPKDAICHAVSIDGLHFERDATNPIFHPTGNWNAGRAIDADVVRDGNRWLLYAATRDPEMKVQMVVGASSTGGLGRDAWKPLADHPILKPELPWEKDCIEAPSLLKRDGWLYMFYAGAYNNAPQQIGVARSRDGVRWERKGTEPLLRNGKPGEWNSSESGHPGVFVDDDGQTYLFFQGNNDNGQTWLLSFVRVGWRDGWPYVMPKVVAIAHRGEHLRHPENTLPAFQAAIDAGADYFELDVRTTADGRLVLMHDATVDRTTKGHGEVAKLSFDEVRALGLPTFEEALELARGKIGVYIDAKGISAKNVVDNVGRFGLEDEVVVYGNAALLGEIRKLNPRIRLMPEAGSPANARKLIDDLALRVLAFDARDFTDETIAAAGRRDVYVDRLGPLDTAEAWEAAVRRGATGIQTDHPAELVAFLRSKGWHE